MLDFVLEVLALAAHWLDCSKEAGDHEHNDSAFVRFRTLTEVAYFPRPTAGAAASAPLPDHPQHWK
jgi:hypothetical protein